MADEEEMVTAEDAADEIGELAFGASEGDLDEAVFLLGLSAVRLVLHHGDAGAGAARAVQRVQAIVLDVLTSIDDEGDVVVEEDEEEGGPASLDPGDPP